MSEAQLPVNTTPTEIFAGTSVDWDFSPTHTPGDDFTSVINIAGPTNFLAITATEADDLSVHFRLAPEDTADFPVGAYQYQIMSSDGTDTYLEAQGQILINALIGEAGDFRSVAKKIIDAIDALILGRADTDQMSYQIGNRALSRIPLPDLKLIRREYAYIYAAQQRRERVEAGLSPTPSIKFRFGSS